MAFTRLRISTQLLILVLGTAVALAALLGIIAIFQSRELLQEQATDQATAVATTASELIAEPLAAHDTATVERIISAIVQNDTIDRMSVFDQAGELLIEQTSPDTEGEATPEDDAAIIQAALQAGEPKSQTVDDVMEIAVPVRVSDQVVGFVVGETALQQAADVANADIPEQLAVGLGVALLAAVFALVISRYIAQPIRQLAAAATVIGRGDLQALPTTNRGGEVGELTRAFGQMVVNLRSSQAELAAQNQTLAERTADLSQTLAELREAATARDQFSATIRELASPVVPILDGILVMPLIGSIDSARAAALLRALLAAIERHSARSVILDVTGVPLIDTQVARALIQAADSARLLGARTVLVGLRPELAQTIVGLGVDLSGLRTRADLQSAVSEALHDTR